LALGLALNACQTCKNCDVKDKDGKAIKSEERCGKKKEKNTLAEDLAAQYDCSTCNLDTTMAGNDTTIIYYKCGKTDYIKQYQDSIIELRGNKVSCSLSEPTVICD